MGLTYFVRTGGNNSNDGLSYANAKLNLGAAATLAVAGDAIRVAKTSDPTSMGNALWTQSSNVIVLSQAATLLIDSCDVAWTANTNVTSTVQAGAGLYKTGTGAIKLVVAGAFTTGRIAHHTLASTDFSGYQQATFWIQSTIAVAAGVLALKLCSDTGGVTAVNTFTINEALIANTWRAVTIDLATNLDTAVQSVALYAISDPGAATIYMDNINAALASSNARSLTLTSLLGKNTAGETFYPIMSIIGTSVVVNGSITADPIPTTPPQLYAGTTETVTTYKRETAFGTPNNSSVTSSWGNIACTGTAALPITISGGWDESTSMTTQTGTTWRTERTNKDMGLSIVSPAAYVNISKLNFTQHRFGVYITNANNITLNGVEMCGNSEYGAFTDGVTPGANTYTNCIFVFHGTIGVSTGIRDTFTSPICNSNAVYGLYFNTWGNCTVTDPICKLNLVDGIDFSYSSGNRIYRPVTALNAEASFHYNAGTNFVFGATTSEATETVIGTGTQYLGGRILSQDDNATGVYKIFSPMGTITSTTVTREKPSGIAWKMSVTNTNASAIYPLQLGAIAKADGIKIYCEANKLATVSARVMRDNTGITLDLICPGGQITGVPVDVSTSASALANVYETITITFTPTQAGFVDVFLRAYGGTTFSAYVDELPALMQV